ncbi:hypothetical protein C900_01942 [Fulvivirga imtechensis AK7]|uniref:DNA-binding protein n=1 Tax=Fulvivirga imtechensis AK7 TaxID=1237149 RepID=L8JXJ4_9BACT|nr:hypothetical protein [Fulvivirga imtechensis]ELR71947.1 hypothetical protein C900_01942 [Fulvivirga imtechensis AK7]
MTKITVSPDCGNAPKREFIKQLSIAFAQRDVDFLVYSVTAEIAWNVVGDKVIEGNEKFDHELKQIRSGEVAELVIERILTHGKEGAASGTMIMQNGKKYAFSDFYEFSGAKDVKVKSITSFNN